MMNYLFLDTSSSRLIVAILKNMEIAYYFNELNGKDLSGKIMSVVDEGFKNTNLKPRDINKIFIVNGPGSFTGIRVGLTVVKMMAWSLNIPLIPLSELELLATVSNHKVIVPLIDARRGYVYGGVYDNELNNIIPDEHILKEELFKKVTDYEIVEDGNVDVVRIVKKHEFDTPSNPHELKPNYLKKTEAEENYDKNS